MEKVEKILLGTIIVFLFIIAILGIAFLGLMTITSEPDYYLTNEPITEIEPEDTTPEVDSQYDDDKFMDWADSATDTQQHYTDLILNDLKYFDVSSLLSHSKLLSDCAKSDLIHCQKFYVSSNLNQIKNEYEMYLRDLHTATNYLVMSCESYFESDYDSAVDYMETGREHIRLAVEHLNYVNEMNKSMR